MKFDLIEKEDTMFGESFDVTLKVTNDNTDPRDIKATLTATVVYYTGVAVKVIKSETYNIMAPGNSGNSSSVLIITGWTYWYFPLNLIASKYRDSNTVIWFSLRLIVYSTLK